MSSNGPKPTTNTAFSDLKIGQSNLSRLSKLKANMNGTMPKILQMMTMIVCWRTVIVSSLINYRSSKPLIQRKSEKSLSQLLENRKNSCASYFLSCQSLKKSKKTKKKQKSSKWIRVKLTMIANKKQREARKKTRFCLNECDSFLNTLASIGRLFIQ